MASRLVGRALLQRKMAARFASTVTAPASATSSPPAPSGSLPPLSNIEASWKSLAPAEQEAVFKHLEQLQKKDWTELTLDQKKAAYYVAFGPHGPREPHLAPGSSIKIAAGTVAAIAVAVGLFAAVRSQAPPPVPTMTKEWKEATHEKLIENRANPFSGAFAKHEAEEAAKHK